jgi:hypothetical protein
MVYQIQSCKLMSGFLNKPMCYVQEIWRETFYADSIILMIGLAKKKHKVGRCIIKLIHLH